LFLPSLQVRHSVDELAALLAGLLKARQALWRVLLTWRSLQDQLYTLPATTPLTTNALLPTLLSTLTELGQLVGSITVSGSMCAVLALCALHH
jgi:hypothetical protein